MNTTPTDATDEPQAVTLTLNDRRQAFNRAYQSAHGFGIMSAPSIPPLFVPGALILGNGTDIGINRKLVQSGTGLLLEAQAYPGMQAGDVIEIFLHPQSLITPPTPVKTATLGIGREGLDIALYVPQQRVEEGMLYLYCRVTRAGTHEVDESPWLSVWCKLSLPAGPDLKPDEPWHSALNAPQVMQRVDEQTLGEFVQVTIEPYLGMAAGDTLRLHIGLEQQDYPVREQDIGQTMTVHVPAEVLRSAGDSDGLALYYRVIDPLNNVSEKASARTFVQVSLGSKGLDAPFVFDNDAPQVIDTRSLGDADVPLSVKVDLPDFQPRDELEVVGIGMGALGQRVEIRPARQVIGQVGNAYLFMLPNPQVQRLARGLLMVGYTQRRGNVEVGQSLHRYIDVLGRAPELPEPVLVEAHNGALDPALPRCTVAISYPSMSPGDWVELFFYGHTGAGYAYAWTLERSVSRNDALRQQITFSIGAEHLSALEGGAVQPRYQVSNDSLPSPLESLHGWVQVGELLAELAPPEVPAAGDHGTLAQADTRGGVDVIVAANPCITPDSVVTVKWLGDTALGTCEGVAEALVYKVPQALAQASVGHSVEVTYTVRNPDDGRLRLSLPLQLRIIADEPVVLRAPVALDVDGAVLDPTFLPSGVRLQAAYQGMLVGDEVVLRLTGKQAYNAPAVRVEPFRPVVFSVPAEVLRGNAGELIQVTYSVAREGQPSRVSPALNLQVLNALGIVLSPLELNGLSIKVEGWKATSTVSVGNTATRVASGGVPPYTYASNNPTVATVNAAGLVTGNRNGTAVISATDLRGTQVSYPVRVSNVYRLVHNWGPVNHHQAVAWMNSLGNAEPCSGRAVADLQRVYGRTLVTGGYWHFWLCEKNGCGGSGFAFYHATNHAVFCADYFNTNIHAAWCIQRT